MSGKEKDSWRQTKCYGAEVLMLTLDVTAFSCQDLHKIQEKQQQKVRVRKKKVAVKVTCKGMGRISARLELVQDVE